MFTLAELTLMRQALDVITITGKDAQYVAQLQVKIEQQLTLFLRQAASKQN